MTARLTALLLILCAAATPTLAATSEHLVTQLDVDRVEVTTRYQGQRILLFGAVPVGSQVIVKMVSPVQEVELSHKTRIGPLWLQGGHLTVFGAPDLVYLVSSSPLDRLFDFGQRETLGLTLQSALKNAVTRGDAALESDWQQAFLHLKQTHRRYLEDGQAVELKDDRLFYAHMDLPADSPLGRYRLSIYLVRNGKVVRRQEATLEVQEVSLESWVSRMVHDHPWLFGVFFTLGVMLLGFVLGVVLRPPREA
ncbi:MAG: TIGR02186 family protein [Candidatus Thiodiazotropha sp.]